MPTTTAAVSAARFVLDLPGSIGQTAFSELVTITSQVSTPPSGPGARTKSFATTDDQPTVVLKRAFDPMVYKALSAWHGQARSGSPDARRDGTLSIISGDGGKPTTFSIRGAWCQELTVNGLSAGSSSVAVLQVTIACDAVEPI